MLLVPPRMSGFAALVRNPVARWLEARRPGEPSGGEPEVATPADRAVATRPAPASAHA